MSMPNDLILVRHGESEGNLAASTAKQGDHSWYSEEFITTPGHRWRLTDFGRQQAAATGQWLTQEFASSKGPLFQAHLVSPYVRTRETAAHLGLPDARWMMNRALRERDWGDIGAISKQEFASSPQYAANFGRKSTDPLYWVPPGGESMAQVAEDRVRNVLSTLHREQSGNRVIAVTHGECMWGFRIVLERLSDEQYIEMAADKSQRCKNAEALHYTRIDPESGQQQRKLRWVRRAAPVFVDGQWRMDVSPWRKLEFIKWSNQELLDQVARVPSLAPKSTF